MRDMEVLLTWLGTGFGALFVVAVAVAWWEHLSRTARPLPPPPAETGRAVSIDVKLDTVAGILGDAIAPPGDSVKRRVTLDGAMGRMSKPGADARRTTWTDTSPMVQGALHPELRKESPHDEHH
jgi:hypothetical protein